jgi:hypothetical protein
VLTHTRHYGIHGVSVSVRAEPRLLCALDRRLRTFAQHADEHPAQLSFDYAAAAQSAAPETARPIYDPEDGTAVYDDRTDTLSMRLGKHIHATCAPEAGRTQINVEALTSRNRWLVSHAVLTLPLLEMLKRRGLFGIHASGVARDGRAVILAGASGSGKSTLSLILADAGFDFLSDDMLFLKAAHDGLRVLAFPDEIDVTEDTAMLLPGLRSLLDEPRLPGWPKWSFRLEDRFATSIAWSCRPAALVVPRIAEVDRSRLEPMRPDQALLELVPNVLLTSPEASQAHLAVLARLTAETPCYRLLLTRDVNALPGLLGELLA